MTGVSSVSLNLAATKTADFPVLAAICSMVYFGSSKARSAKNPLASSIGCTSDLIRFSTEAASKASASVRLTMRTGTGAASAICAARQRLAPATISKLCLVQHLVCDFVNKGAELLGWRLAGKQNDLASVAHTQRRGNTLFELKQDALGCDEIEQTFHALSHITTDTARKLWKLQALSLRNIEDIYGTEAN